MIPTRRAKSTPGICSLISSIAPCMARPARTARSGSSSWATGAPKTAITLSPMNLSTVPPKRVTSSPSRLSARSTMDLSASGSIRSATAVYPERSANSTVALRRSSGRASGAAAGGEGGVDVSRDGGAGQRGPALDAELRARRVLLAAAWAGGGQPVPAGHAKASPVGVLRAAGRTLHPHVPEVTYLAISVKVRSVTLGQAKWLSRISRHLQTSALSRSGCPRPWGLARPAPRPDAPRSGR